MDLAPCYFNENPGTSMISKVKRKTEISCVPNPSVLFFGSGEKRGGKRVGPS